MRALLYTRSSCEHCRAAKELLRQHGVEWAERSLDGDRAASQRLMQLFGKPTMPYVFLDDEPIGGLEELRRLAESGELSGPD